MYLEHYGLKRKPFQISADPDFLWLGDTHRQSLAMLRQNITANRGIVVLSGKAGTGKTVLVKRLMSEVDVDIVLVSLAGPGLSSQDFYRLLSESFEIKPGLDSREAFIPHLRNLLSQRHSGRRQVLIIDDAHYLDQRLLEEIRLLSGMKHQGHRLIEIGFVGQPRLHDILSKPENRDLAQRISIRQQIEPLEEFYIAAFIEHRLETAGCSRHIFTPSAIFVIHELTGGIPRLINMVCHRALQKGHARGLEQLDDGVIRASAADLGLPIRPRMPQNIARPMDRPVQSNGGQQNGRLDMPAESPPEPAPEAPPTRGARWKWLYAAPLVLLVAYFTYHFNYLNAEEEPRRSDQLSGYWRTESKTDGITEESFAEAAGEEKESTSPLKDKIMITFDTYSNELDPESFAQLDTVAGLMARHPGQTVVVRGYTDNSGPIDLNMRISRQRAEAVKSYLVGKGAEPEKIEVIAMGPENPIASNDTPQHRRQNRRVEIEFP